MMRLTVNYDPEGGIPVDGKTRQAMLDDLVHHLRTEILGELDLGVQRGDGWEVVFATKNNRRD